MKFEIFFFSRIRKLDVDMIWDHGCPGCVCVCTKRNVAFACAVAFAVAFDFFKRNPDKSWAILNQRVDHMLFR